MKKIILGVILAAFSISAFSSDLSSTKDSFDAQMELINQKLEELKNEKELPSANYYRHQYLKIKLEGLTKMINQKLEEIKNEDDLPPASYYYHELLEIKLKGFSEFIEQELEEIMDEEELPSASHYIQKLEEIKEQYGN